MLYYMCRCVKFSLWLEYLIYNIVCTNLDGAGESGGGMRRKSRIIFTAECIDMAFDNARRRPHDDKILRVGNRSVLQPQPCDARTLIVVDDFSDERPFLRGGVVFVFREIRNGAAKKEAVGEIAVEDGSAFGDEFLFQVIRQLMSGPCVDGLPIGGDDSVDVVWRAVAAFDF